MGQRLYAAGLNLGAREQGRAAKHIGGCGKFALLWSARISLADLVN
jgi:hypothetical protein